VSCAHLKPVIVQVYGSLLSASSLELISGLLPACTGVEAPPGRAIVRRMAGATGGCIWVRLGAEASRKGPSCTQHARGDVLMHAACARAPGCLVPMTGNSQTAGLRRPGSARAPRD